MSSYQEQRDHQGAASAAYWAARFDAIGKATTEFRLRTDEIFAHWENKRRDRETRLAAGSPDTRGSE
jgi:hypothetical protein